MQPEDRDAAYLWDMLQTTKEIDAMLEEHDLPAFLANKGKRSFTDRMLSTLILC